MAWHVSQQLIGNKTRLPSWVFDLSLSVASYICCFILADLIRNLALICPLFRTPLPSHSFHRPRCACSLLCPNSVCFKSSAYTGRSTILATTMKCYFTFVMYGQNPACDPSTFAH